jgi:hypothetical protein
MSKFSGAYAEELDEMVNDGMADVTIGSVDELGRHYAKFDGEEMTDGSKVYAILYTNSDGFVDSTLYDTPEELEEAWTDIEAEYDQYYDERANEED